MNRKLIILLIIAIVTAAGASAFAYFTNKPSAREQINSFEECKNAGYPIQESYPEVCAVPGGKSFPNPDQSMLVPVGLRECPDEWIEDRMPGPDPKENRQYFIINGQRAELEDYDVEWIKANCEVSEPSPVY